MDEYIKRFMETLDEDERGKDIEVQVFIEGEHTIDKLGLLLKFWDQTDASLIRFYPPSKAARFDRYDIRPE